MFNYPKTYLLVDGSHVDSLIHYICTQFPVSHTLKMIQGSGSWSLLGWIISFTTLTTIAILLRYWSANLQKRNFYADDGLVIAAYVSIFCSILPVRWKRSIDKLAMLARNVGPARCRDMGNYQRARKSNDRHDCGKSNCYGQGTNTPKILFQFPFYQICWVILQRKAGCSSLHHLDIFHYHRQARCARPLYTNLFDPDF